jgi:hypothetical protein
VVYASDFSFIFVDFGNRRPNVVMIAIRGLYAVELPMPNEKLLTLILRLTHL